MIAFPLVSGGVLNAGIPAPGVVPADAGISFPQTLQNFSPAAILFPQPEQNTKCDLTVSACSKFHCRNLQRTVLHGLHYVNRQEGFIRLPRYTAF